MTKLFTLLHNDRRWRRTPASLALATVALLAVVAVVAAQSDLTTPSPARGHAQVISQGMSAPPATLASWRVVEREIPLRVDARPADRMEGAAGFLLAGATPVFVTDQDTKLRTRLGPGEAAFVPTGANQTWASVEEGATTAFTLELAATEGASEDAGGQVLFASDAFGMAEGDYDLDLVRDVLSDSEVTDLDATAFPILLFATGGEIEIRSDAEGVEPARLAVGQAAAVEGNLTIRGRSPNRATFVAAIAGASIGGGRTADEAATPEPAATEEPTEAPTEEPTAEPNEEPATQEPTEAEATEEPAADAEPTEEPTEEAAEPTPEGRTGDAEVRLRIRLCPAGTGPEDLDDINCQAAEGEFDLTLVTPDGEELGLQDANRVDPGYVRWSGLDEGDHFLSVSGFPDGYDTSSLDGYVCCTDGGDYTIVLESGDSIAGTLYFFEPE